MTITRRWQAGFDSNGTGSMAEVGASTVAPSAVNTQAKTGTYSMRVALNSVNIYGLVAIAPTRQFRTGAHINIPHTAVASKKYSIISWLDGSANLLGRIYFDSADDISLEIAGTTQDTEADAVSIAAFANYALDIKVDSSAGWAKVYKDGNEILSFTGNTGNADVSEVRFGTGTDIPVDANISVYYDDLYVDDTTGESAAACPPDLRFLPIVPNGNGNYSQCTGSDGNSTDNYALVDDRPHNSDTDYNLADALDERDTYAMGNITLGAGYQVNAVIPFVYAKKTDGSVATQIALALRESSTDWTGATQNLPTSYSFMWERTTTRPGGSNWDETSVNALESGFVGKGTF